MEGVKAAVEVLQDELEKVAATTPAKGDLAINTLLVYIKNVLKDPQDPKFQKIGVLNKAFNSRIACFPSAKPVLASLGWKEGLEENFLVLSPPVQFSLFIQ